MICGAGICHASHRRPLFNLRPGYITFGGSKSPCSGLRHFQADSHLISWLHNKELDYEMVDFHSDRPGHDLRYGLDGNKLFNMGFKLPLNFEESLRKTVEWTLENQKWLEE